MIKRGTSRDEIFAWSLYTIMVAQMRLISGDAEVDHRVRKALVKSMYELMEHVIGGGAGDLFIKAMEDAPGESDAEDTLTGIFGRKPSGDA